MNNNYITFGRYEQDNDTSNGKEDIEWLILDIQDNKALVISKYALDCKPYNTKRKDVTWETCTLRQWLNNNFLNTAFAYAEKAKIATTKVKASKNPNYSTDPGNYTEDKVFLLSIYEVNKYFSSDSARQCEPTKYTQKAGVYTIKNCCWWLRSPGYFRFDAAYVLPDGGVRERGYFVNYTRPAVRPALWIDLDS